MSGTLATERDDQRAFAEQRLWHWLQEIDQSCNRFHADSELSRLNARGEATISATFERALQAGLYAYEVTGGLCDPTVLPALMVLGYDVDYEELLTREGAGVIFPVRNAGPERRTPRHLARASRRHRVTLAQGCQVRPRGKRQSARGGPHR